MSVVVSAHGLLARALLLYALVLAVWGTYLYFRRAAVNGGFRASYLILGGLTVVQGIAGAVAFIAGQRPTEILHLVYGVFAVLFVPGMYLYSQGGSKRREAVLLAIGAWVVAIAYFRGIATG